MIKIRLSSVTTYSTVRFEIDRARIEWVLRGFVPRPRNPLKIKNCDDFEWVARFCVGFALTVNKSNAIKCRIKILSSITTQTFDRAARAQALQLFTRARVLSGHCLVNFKPCMTLESLAGFLNFFFLLISNIYNFFVETCK